MTKYYDPTIGYVDGKTKHSVSVDNVYVLKTLTGGMRMFRNDTTPHQEWGGYSWHDLKLMNNVSKWGSKLGHPVRHEAYPYLPIIMSESTGSIYYPDGQKYD